MSNLEDSLGRHVPCGSAGYGLTRGAPNVPVPDLLGGLPVVPVNDVAVFDVDQVAGYGIPGKVAVIHKANYQEPPARFILNFYRTV